VGGSLGFSIAAPWGARLRERREGERKDAMLRIYDTILEVIRLLRPATARIESHDRDLARQLRRCSSSIALNCSEGSGSNGGTRKERYKNALGSARETGACLDVALAAGYVEAVDAELLDKLDKVRATLARNIY
jgi:four helix bundle protein